MSFQNDSSITLLNQQKLPASQHPSLSICSDALTEHSQQDWPNGGLKITSTAGNCHCLGFRLFGLCIHAAGVRLEGSLYSLHEETLS